MMEESSQAKNSRASIDDPVPQHLVTPSRGVGDCTMQPFVHTGHQGQNTALPTAAATTTSTPVSPGPSSPLPFRAWSLRQKELASAETIPSPVSDHQLKLLEHLDKWSLGRATTSTKSHTKPLPIDHARGPDTARTTSFDQLPVEIHSTILDYLFCDTTRPSSTYSPAQSRATALRPTTRRELSSLALVNKTWTYLVQKRLFRKIRLRGTCKSMETAANFFGQNLHLREYVRHVDVWFPVIRSSRMARFDVDFASEISRNCTLEDVFVFMSNLLPRVRVLSLEGGDSRNAPKVITFSRADPANQDSVRSLPTLQTVTTLIVNGQWNLIRDEKDWSRIQQALPNLQEWQSFYNTATAETYLCMDMILMNLSRNITKLHLNMEGTAYISELTAPDFVGQVAASIHTCVTLAGLLPHLQHLSYTGRLCYRLFEAAGDLLKSRVPKLQSLDLTVKNCCCYGDTRRHSGSGIHNKDFIDAFAMLVKTGVRMLSLATSLDYMRIRFVDMSCNAPAYNPYFTLRENSCTGIWDEELVQLLAQVRPEAAYEELEEHTGKQIYEAVFRESFQASSNNYKRTYMRKSIKLSEYVFMNRVSV